MNKKIISVIVPYVSQNKSITVTKHFITINNNNNFNIFNR